MKHGPADETNSNPTLQAALDYTRREWKVIPVPHREKIPVLKAWEQLRLVEADLSRTFQSRPQNIGVLLGEPSNWLIDVDLDHPLAVELADQFLPSTPAMFGRPSKRRSHWLYRVTSSVSTKKFRSKSAGMIVELRSTGMQTVFPPSTHVSNEPITWENPGAIPTDITPDSLLEAVKRLAEEVKVRLGEKPNNKPARHQKQHQSSYFEYSGTQIIQGCRNDTLTSIAGRMRCRGASEWEIDQALQSINQTYCQPPLESDEVSGIAKSIAQYPPGTSDTAATRPFCSSDDGVIKLGSYDPVSGRLVLSQKQTIPTADAFLRRFYDHSDAKLLIAYGAVFYVWRDGCYRELEDGTIQQQLLQWLHQALRYTFSKSSNTLELTDFESNPSTVKAALESIRTRVFLPSNVPVPSWRMNSEGRPPPLELVCCRSKLLHLPTGQYLSASPALLTFNALEFDHDHAAPPPVAWLHFLDQLWGTDIESIQLLQEWFGYCLVADTSQQKILLLVGPKRSGKGTIARVLRRLIGDANVCGPTTSSLAGTFGLQPLVGKTLAIVSDARFRGENISTIVERLLCISGEDALTIDRMFLGSVTMKLPTRLMFLSNEIPRLSDTSGALASRFLVLRLTESFHGREDHCLTEHLYSELPSILNWAIEGWHRLRERGYFVQPQSSIAVTEELEELASPIKTFVNARCRLHSCERTQVSDLFGAWQTWCTEQGHSAFGDRQSFGRDLAAALPQLTCRKGTGGVRFYEGIGLDGSGE